LRLWLRNICTILKGETEVFSLTQLGWNDFFEKKYKPYKEKNFIAARVAAEDKQRYLIFSEAGELTGEVTGKLLYCSETGADLPKTGDWIAGILYETEKKVIIHSVLERRTKLSRKTADRKTEEQIIAANIDYVFIVQSLDNNFNIRRMERYITTALESCAQPVIILNKADLRNKPDEIKNEVKNYFPGFEVILSDAIKGRGIFDIKEILAEGTTGVFTGSSGVGKSTIINALIGKEMLKTVEISNAVKKGKHTTTRREMLLIPGAGIVIDTPGMRELQLWNADDGFISLFDDIDSLALKCKFSNCTHTSEKGCAVIDAIEKGIINEEKMKSYRKLKKELNYLEEKQDKNACLKRKEREKKLHKEIKNFYKIKKIIEG
jgi:ribosome biogenesis GTPase / thiamine phosphate phosphatase